MATVLVTGVTGCIGSWVAFHLLKEGHSVIGADTSTAPGRLRLLGIQNGFPLLRADVCDRAALDEIVASYHPNAIIHLAALQIPTCRANPSLCLEVNVGGMLNLLQVSRSHNLALVYASSAAVYGPDRHDLLPEEEGINPKSLYGVFKRTDEEMARIYNDEFGIVSVGFRPHTVYGPGRDVGVTSDVTVALWHALQGHEFEIRFGGQIALQHVSDVARAFIAAALNPKKRAAVYNLRGSLATVAEIISAIETVTSTRNLISYVAVPLPIAANLDDGHFQKDYGPFEYLDLRAGLLLTLDVWRKAASEEEANT
jgi:nucleoside-diphosphate-sugar epimerase